MPSFATLELSAELQKALERLGYEAPAPVQVAVLVASNAGRSAVIAAPAFSGRGTALALAALTRAASGGNGVRSLLVAGTRTRVFHLVGLVGALNAAGRKGLPVAALVSGQSPERQAALLESGPAILVATPGVVRKAIHDGVLKLDDLKTLLVDSADELLDGGLGEDLEAIIAAAPPQRAVVALATLISRDLEDLTARRIPEADRLVSELPPPPPGLTWFSMESGEKLQSFTALVDRHHLNRVLVWVNSRNSAETLAERLTEAGYAAEAITNDSTAAARERSLKRFKQGSVSTLVGTVAGWSGLDLEGVDAVVHWDWPLDDAELSARHQPLREGGFGFALASGRELVRARAISRRGSPARLGRLPLLGELAELRLHANVARIREALAGRNPAACRSVVDLLMAEGYEPAVIAGAAIRLLGTPELPTLPPPPAPPASEAPVASPTPAGAPAESLAPETETAVYDAADWSPGVGAASSDEPEGSPVAEGEGGYDSAGESGYTYSDNAAEDGVVYPPGANFGDDELGPEGGTEDRPGRRGRRGGRGRGSRGAEGGPTSSGMKRLWLNVGRMDRIQPRDIVGCILGETGLPSATVGRVQLFERHTLVDVSATFEGQVLDALNRASVRGRKLKAKIAAY